MQNDDFEPPEPDPDMLREMKLDAERDADARHERLNSESGA